MEPPVVNCKCSKALNKAGDARETENECASSHPHDIIRQRLYAKAGIVPSCCEMCEAFELEQRRAHIEWDD